MLRKLALFSSAAALLSSGLFISGSGASTTIFNTSAASVTCNTVIAVASVAPPITTTSTGSAVIKVKGTLGGCTPSGATPSEPTIVSGSFTGTLTTSGGAGGCAGLASPSSISGNLVIKWKVGVGQKLDFSATTLSGGTIQGGVFGGAPWSAYGQFGLTGQSFVAGSAFAGGTPSTTAVTSEDVGNLLNTCSSAPPGLGIKTIHLGLGQVVA